MPSKKAQQKLMKHRACAIARVTACVSFLILTIIAVSSLVRAMSLENIANENGVPSAWETASLGNPDTITVPITYWDQRQDDCSAENRQFEWVICNYWTAGAVQGLVKNHLGKDGLPIPTFTNSKDSWNANYDVFSANITGNDPVQPSDNFYRWFHDTDVSKHYDREVTFQRTGKNTYTYGTTNVFPLDDVDFSDGDSAWEQNGHNYHFTAHLNFATKISADGSELFEFSGDDDVWVYLNGKLVLDIGGLHEKLNGWFRINQDGTISTYVQNVNDTKARAVLGQPSSDFNSYVDPLNKLIRETYSDKYETIDVGLKPGDVVDLDFFYAERSTTESNTKITISNMNWPISADSKIEAEIVGKLPESQSNLVRYNTHITNRDPDHPLDLERLAAYVEENVTTDNGESTKQSGFLPLDEKTLFYTTTPNDEQSWQPVRISAPDNTTAGFNLETPIRMAPNGSTGDTLYFRYYGETSSFSGNMTSLVSYFTTMEGEAGVTYDYATVEYQAPVIDKNYNVKIKYLYEDDSVAAPEYNQTFKPGSEFSVDSPKINEYTPDIKIVSGVVPEHDLVYIVRYKRNVTPEPTPDTPDRPTEPDPEPAKPKLIIHYVYEDGSKAHDDHSEELDPGSKFNVKSPTIDGYTPDYPQVKGSIESEDLEFIVRYVKNPEKPTEPITPEEPEKPQPEPPVQPDTPEEPNAPSNPVTPSEPETPEQPSNPTTPNRPGNYIPYIPGSNIIDGNLLYLAPLGEVAFAPNTGIVSSTLASVFEDGFAEIVLSQAFVMIMLALFAGSFCVYFSLREFMNLEPSKARSSSRNQSSSAKNRKKSYAKMTKTTAKAKKPAKTGKATSGAKLKSAMKSRSKKSAKK